MKMKLHTLYSFKIRTELLFMIKLKKIRSNIDSAGQCSNNNNFHVSIIRLFLLTKRQRKWRFISLAIV